MKEDLELSHDERMANVMKRYKAKAYKYCLVYSLWFDEHHRVYESEEEMQKYIDWLNESNKDSPGHYVVLHKFKLRKMK